MAEGCKGTPDGRYLVVRGRLWRKSNPRLAEDERAELVSELMAARRAVAAAEGDVAARKAARSRVDAAKRALGERGPVWWGDGAPDYTRRLARNTPYANWFASTLRQD
ncbi:MAG: hypothetical protein DI565_19355 [Ancylobacter novellus]|uniref:Uncharacterized protein n=1 Tax=Ancylobacter novellus TaxID=921 RepID=A0A2W5K5Y0_ANCNO|nr:MAG: hypothetical protein DI565_19355 [Ancylobacter novellus]